jgi:O-antigen ligase
MSSDALANREPRAGTVAGRGSDPLGSALSVVLFLYTVGIFLPPTLPGLSRILFSAGALVILVRLLTKGLVIRREPLLLHFCLFAIYSLLSIGWSEFTRESWPYAARVIIGVGGAAMLWIVFWNSGSLRSVLWGAVIGGIANSAIAVYQLLVGNYERATGLVGNANELAMQLTISAFLVFALSSRMRWPQWTFVLVMLSAATWVSGSRTIVFAFLAVTLYSLSSAWKQVKGSKATLGVALLAVPLLLTLLIFAGEVFWEHIRELTVYRRWEAAFAGGDKSTTERSMLFFAGIELWRQSPLIGFGIDQFRMQSPYGIYSHSNFTELLSGLGLMGLGLYYSIHGVLLLRARTAARGRLLLVSVLLSVLVGISTVGYVDSAHWLWLSVLGCMSRQRRPARKPILGASSLQSDAIPGTAPR